MEQQRLLVSMQLRHSDIDLVAYGRDGRVLLLAEAKSRRGTSETWAAGLRKNMLSHGVLPASQYFLIATPEWMYFWNDKQTDAVEMQPQVTVDASTVLKPYSQRLHQELSDIGPEAFEYLVLAWLQDVARPDRGATGFAGEQGDASSQWLAELSKSLKEAAIELNPH